MTAAPSNTPLSVDYTGRDYYALRDQLIARVQDRVPDWQGTDPNDFGLALVEAFSYMGDLINYYIDRVANESYLLTATQRESLLNIAATYGYTPASYVSASTTIDITNSNQGYKGQIGGAIIEDGTISGVTLGNYAKIIVPNDHPFTSDAIPATGFFNTVKVNSVPASATGVVGDHTLTYGTSAFNGTFPVSFVGYDNFGKNVVWYRPSANATNVAPVTAVITSATGNGTTVTYTATNTYAVGDVVTVTGLTTTTGSTLNLAKVTISTATTYNFTITSATTGTATGTQAGTATSNSSFVVTLSDTNRTMVPYSGQKVLLTGVVSSGYNYNGKWIISGTTPTSTATPDTGTMTIKTNVVGSDTLAAITSARLGNSSVHYSGWNDFIVGETATVTGATTSSFNLSNAIVTATKSIEAAVSRTLLASSIPTYIISEQLSVGDIVTIRGIASVGNELAVKDLGYNLSDQLISDVTATTTAVINGVSGGMNGTASSVGTITYQTGASHGWSVGDYVTISGVLNGVSGSVTQTDVYNLKSAKILAVPTPTSFVVEGYWTNPYTSGGLGTVYAFTLTTASVSGSALSTGSAVSEYFKVANPTSGATVTAATGNGTTVTYTAVNTFVANQKVYVTNLVTTTGASLNLGTSVSPVTIASATSTAFTVTNSTVGTATGTQTGHVTATSVVTAATGNGTTITYTSANNYVVGQSVTVTGLGISSGSTLNLSEMTIATRSSSQFTVTNTTVGVSSGTGSVSLVGMAVPTATVTAAAGNGTTVTYTAANTFSVGDTVTITGLTTTTGVPLNLASQVIVTASATQFTISNAAVGTAVATQAGTARAIASISTFTSGLATAQIGGTYSAGGTIVYNEIPTLILSGPFVTNIGSTTIPKGTQVRTQVTVDGGVKDVIFSTQSIATVPFRETASVLVVHGEDVSLRAANAANTTANPHDIPGEFLGYSKGTADQMFALSEVQVDPSTIHVYVDNGVIWEEWLQVSHIQDYTPTSKVFEVNVTATETVQVVFGEGVSGAIPPKEAGIKAVYIAGGGTLGNVAANSLTTWDQVLGTDATVIKGMPVTNVNAATGGADPESNDSIRYNAPRALRALNRAVTLDDFASLALTVDGVVKANAVAESRSSVTLYIAPTSNGSAGDTPGVGSDFMATPQMLNFMSLVSQYLADKTQIGTTVTVLNPIYSPVHVEVKYSALPQYNPATVSTALTKAIVTNFSYDNLDFADVITPEEVEFKLRQVDGVSNVKVTEMYRVGGSGRNSLLGDPYEIFSFTEAEIGLTAAQTEARISTLVFAPLDSTIPTPLSTGVATVSPAINGGVYAYSLGLPSGTTQIGVTAVTLGSKATVAVNDNAATGGVVTVPVPAESNTLIVTVTAEDGVTVLTYRFTVTVAT